MSSLNLFLSHFAFAQFTLAFLILFPRAKQSLQVRLYCILMATVMLYLIPQMFGTLPLHSVAWLVVFVASNILPGVFYLVGLSVFSDRIEIKPWQYSLAFLPLALASMAQILLALNNPPPDSIAMLASVIKVCVMLIELGLMSYALFIALKFWRDDLVARSLEQCHDAGTRGCLSSMR